MGPSPFGNIRRNPVPRDHQSRAISFFFLLNKSVMASGQPQPHPHPHPLMPFISSASSVPFCSSFFNLTNFESHDFDPFPDLYALLLASSKLLYIFLYIFQTTLQNTHKYTHTTLFPTSYSTPSFIFIIFFFISFSLCLF